MMSVIFTVLMFSGLALIVISVVAAIADKIAVVRDRFAKKNENTNKKSKA